MHDFSMPDLQTDQRKETIAFFSFLSFFLSSFLSFFSSSTFPPTSHDEKSENEIRDKARTHTPWLVEIRKFAVETTRVFSICIYTVSRPKDPPFSISFSAKNIFRAATCFKALKGDGRWKGGGWARTRSLFLSFQLSSFFILFYFQLSDFSKRESYNISSILFVSSLFPRFLSSVILDLREYTYPRVR